MNVCTVKILNIGIDRSDRVSTDPGKPGKCGNC